jgi:hypothetical protein
MPQFGASLTIFIRAHKIFIILANAPKALIKSRTLFWAIVIRKEVQGLNVKVVTAEFSTISCAVSLQRINNKFYAKSRTKVKSSAQVFV